MIFLRKNLLPNLHGMPAGCVIPSVMMDFSLWMTIGVDWWCVSEPKTKSESLLICHNVRSPNKIKKGIGSLDLHGECVWAAIPSHGVVHCVLLNPSQSQNHGAPSQFVLHAISIIHGRNIAIRMWKLIRNPIMAAFIILFKVSHGSLFLFSQPRNLPLLRSACGRILYIYYGCGEYPKNQIKIQEWIWEYGMWFCMDNLCAWLFPFSIVCLPYACGCPSIFIAAHAHCWFKILSYMRAYWKSFPKTKAKWISLSKNISKVS